MYSFNFSLSGRAPPPMSVTRLRGPYETGVPFMLENAKPRGQSWSQEHVLPRPLGGGSFGIHFHNTVILPSTLLGYVEICASAQ